MFEDVENTKTEPETEGAADAGEDGGRTDIHVLSGRHKNRRDEGEHEHVVALLGNLLCKFKLCVHVGEGARVQAFSCIANSS